MPPDILLQLHPTNLVDAKSQRAWEPRTEKLGLEDAVTCSHGGWCQLARASDPQSYLGENPVPVAQLCAQ